MYIWNLFKTLIFLLFCSGKFVFSEDEDVEEQEDIIGVDLNLFERRSNHFYVFKETFNHDTYTANSGYGFSVVKVTNWKDNGEKIYWKANDNSELSYQVKLSKFIFDGMFTLTIYLLDGSERLFIKDPSIYWTEVDLSKKIGVYALMKPVFDIFAYSTQVKDGFAMFTANKGFGICGLLDEERTLIWKTENPNEYADKIIIDRPKLTDDTMNVTIISGSRSIRHFVFDGTGWVEAFPSATLNISRKKSTYEYRYLRQNNIEYFIANGSLGFKRVQFNCRRRTKRIHVDLWEAGSRRDYANKAILVCSKNKDKFLVLILIRGGFLLFYWSHYHKKWEDHTNIPNTVNELRLAGLDITDMKPANLRYGRKQLHPHSLPPFKMYLSPQDPKPIHMPYFPPKPLQPTAKGFKPPELPVAKPLHPIKPCSLLDMGPRNLIILDITKMDNLFGYEISYARNKAIFTAKPLFLFRQVKFQDTILWDYNGADYPYKVVYSEINGQNSVKVYFGDESRANLVPQPRFHRHIDASEIQVEVMKYKKGP